MKKDFRWGIIGTGGIANAFARDLDYLNGHKVTAVLSRSKKSANNFISKISNAKGFDDLNMFMHYKEIDAVYIATPNTFHCEQTIAALESKKPVLCEKPFAMNTKEAMAMVNASQKHNTTLLEGMWTRYLPHIKFINNILKEKKIGTIQTLFACIGHNLTHSNNPRFWTKELGGGALLDLGIYPTSFAHMILGSPKEIIANSVFTDLGVDIKTSMIFKYENGSLANLSCTMNDSPPNLAVISGDKGRIEIDHAFYAPATLRVMMDGKENISYAIPYNGHGLREQANELENCVEKGAIESNKMPHSESIAVMETIDKIREQIGLKFD